MKKFLGLLRYILPYWVKAVLNILFNFLAVVFSLFSFTMAKPFLDILFQHQELVTTQVPFEFTAAAIQQNFNYYLSSVVQNQGEAQALLLVSLLVVSAVFFKTGFWYLANFFMAPLRNNVIRDIRNNIFRKILQLPLAFYSEERKGDIISRMTGDVQEIEVSIVRSLNVVFKEPITIIVYLISLLVWSPQLTLFVFVLLPISGLIIGQVGKNLRKKSLEGQIKMGAMLSIIEETLSGLRIVKAFNSEEKVNKRFTDVNESYTNILTKMWRRQYLASPLSELLGSIVIVIIMWYGGSLVLEHQTDISSSDFMVYLLIFSQIINPAKAFSTAYYSIRKGMASVDRIDIILQAENTIKEKSVPEHISEFKESIEYKNVTFSYTETDVLKNINVKLTKGETIALVGQSGSGKSTFVDLLPRFYDVPEGEILVDGISVKNYKTSELRNLMGIVNQDPILFNDTIYNNIAFGVENATEENIIAAAKVANAHDFIMETTEGYETNIGDRGSKLSGGQRQRLSIARAVLKNPPIMILDEATSALDSESEKLVQDALNNLMKNRTSIVIAHRLSTVHHVDEILVLHEGKIVERGKHEELIQLDGVYKKLNDLQVFA